MSSLVRRFITPVIASYQLRLEALRWIVPPMSQLTRARTSWSFGPSCQRRPWKSRCLESFQRLLKVHLELGGLDNGDLHLSFRVVDSWCALHSNIDLFLRQVSSLVVNLNKVASTEIRMSTWSHLHIRFAARAKHCVAFNIHVNFIYYLFRSKFNALPKDRDHSASSSRW